MIAALMLARSESWCLGLTLRAASLYCDAVVFTDHRSDDDTPDIVREVGRETGLRIDYRRDDSDRWDEMDARQEQLVRARSIGATRMVIVDADELPTANVVNVARSLVEQVPRGHAGALPMVAPFDGVHVRRVDGSLGRRSRMTWAFHDAPSVKGWAPDGGYHHHMRTPNGCPVPPAYLAGVESGGNVDLGYGGIFHLQFVSRRRLVEKAVWYKVMETLRYPGRMSAAELNAKYDWAIRAYKVDPDSPPPERMPVPDEWWRGYIDRGWTPYLDTSAGSWQGRDAKRLAARAPASALEGLDLYGVV